MPEAVRKKSFGRVEKDIRVDVNVRCVKMDATYAQ